MFMLGSTGSEGSAIARQRAGERSEKNRHQTNTDRFCSQLPTSVPPRSHRAWARHANPAIFESAFKKLKMAFGNCQASLPGSIRVCFHQCYQVLVRVPSSSSLHAFDP
jgi:hypothetical protein